jgi:hypothetical protein
LVFSARVGILSRVPQLGAAGQPGYSMRVRAITKTCSVQPGKHDDDGSAQHPGAIERSPMKFPD